MFHLMDLAPAVFAFGSNPKVAATFVVGPVLLLALAVYRKRIGKEMLIAAMFALFITSVHKYDYNTPSLVIGWINTFPLVMWTAGLVIAYEVYSRLTAHYRWLAASLIYLVVLCAVEYIGFNWLGIHSEPPLPSLLGLGIIHGPPIIHVFYPTAGPIYLFIVKHLHARTSAQGFA